jgi:hypothetical protein
MEPKPNCLGCGAVEAAIARGLCPACFACANRQVKRGTTSWAQLEGAGKCLPLADPCRPRRGVRKHLFVST